MSFTPASREPRIGTGEGGCAAFGRGRARGTARRSGPSRRRQRELAEDLAIETEHLVEQIERIDAAALGKAQPGHRSEQDGPRFEPLRLRFAIFVDDLQAVERQVSGPRRVSGTM